MPSGVPPPGTLDHRRRWRSRSRSPSGPSPGSHTHNLSPSPPRRVGRSRSASRASSGPQNRLSSSPHQSVTKHAHSASNRVPTDAGPPQRLHAKAKDRPPSPSSHKLSDTHVANSEGQRAGRHTHLREVRCFHHHTGKSDGKGKGRADDRADTSDDESRPTPSREEEDMNIGGSVRAGMNKDVNNSPASQGGGENGDSLPVLSTLPSTAELSVTIGQEVGPSTTTTPVAPSVQPADKATLPARQRNDNGSNGQASILLSTSLDGRPSVRIRRNPWQTMHQYLAGGVSGPRCSRLGDGTTGAELASATQPQARQDAAANPRDEALRPEDPSLSGGAVPSLLLRLSDPAPPAASATHRHGSSGVRDRARARLAGHEGGKGISASEMMGRTRVSSVALSSADDLSTGPSRPPLVQHPGPGRQPHNAVESGDVSAVEQTSSENADHARETARSGVQAEPFPVTADPRSLLMQKLEAEKRDAADIPTAEKTQLSSAHRPFVPMALADGSAGEPSKSASDVATAERIAERREAELRTQAQLRVRLAAAKREVQRGSAAMEGGSEGSTATIDGDLAVQESSLRSRLKARQT
ncbi:hypothetical protein GY45DRAFT_1263592 [Cubamyces sp. BRFM 1775]|nr:hypothetical protein GY45DRAFT_1263592 [Cubamyces sp. BRFM 1775]